MTLHTPFIKKRYYVVYNSLLFKKVLSRMIVKVVYAMTLWTHAFPVFVGASGTRSRRKIVTCIATNVTKHLSVLVGAYVRTLNQHNIMMTKRKLRVIAMRPTVNAQRNFYFLNLQTGRRINQNRWIKLPIPLNKMQRGDRSAESSLLNRLVFGDRVNAKGWDNWIENESESTSSYKSHADSCTSCVDSDDENAEAHEKEGRDATEYPNHEKEHLACPSGNWIVKKKSVVAPGTCRKCL